MSAALMTAASVSFTACNDDDNDEPVYVVGGNTTETPDIQFSSDTVRMKIGEENRAALPIASETGGINAFSLDPAVADIVDVDGVPMIEGFKNGLCDVMVSDDNNNYKKFVVSVYTTEQMQLSTDALTILTPLGGSATSTEASVVLGNGGYSIVSDNPKVTASITPETGEISITVTSKVDPYSATLTVTDISGLSADLKVTVEASFDPFTPAQLQEIMDMTESAAWADCKDPSDENEPYYYGWRNYGYGSWLDSTEGDTSTVGWWYINSRGVDYGGIKIDYPANAAVDAEVEGTLCFQYSDSRLYDLYKYEGNAKVLVDDATKKVVIAWQVDEQNERINRGYVVLIK